MTGQAYQTIRIDVEDGIAWLIMNRPEKRNAMVNGFCIGGGFTQTPCCDFALAAEDATFCLSEVN